MEGDYKIILNKKVYNKDLDNQINKRRLNINCMIIPLLNKKTRISQTIILIVLVNSTLACLLGLEVTKHNNQKNRRFKININKTKFNKKTHLTQIFNKINNIQVILFERNNTLLQLQIRRININKFSKNNNIKQINSIRINKYLEILLIDNKIKYSQVIRCRIRKNLFQNMMKKLQKLQELRKNLLKNFKKSGS